MSDGVSSADRAAMRALAAAPVKRIETRDAWGNRLIIESDPDMAARYRTDVPALLDALAQAEAANVRLRAALEKTAIRRVFWRGGDGAGGYACALCPAQAHFPEWLQHHESCPLSGAAPHFVRCTICGAQHDETYPYRPEPGKFGGRTSAQDRAALADAAPGGEE